MFAPAGLLLICVVGLLLFGGLLLIVAAVSGRPGKRCRHCGARNGAEARFCARCGQAVE